MSVLFKILGLSIIIAGISLIVKPDFLLAWFENNISNTKMYFAAIGIRLILGILLIVAANQSKFPPLIKALGAISIIAALVFLVIGHEQFVEFITMILDSFRSLAPLAAVLSIVIGSFLIIAFSKRNTSKI